MRWWVVAATALAIAGCAEPAGSPAAPALLSGQPATYLLTVDQMVSPDFTVDSAPHVLAAASDASNAGQLAAAGYVAGAAEEFFRPLGVLAEANGPLQVRDTVERFSSAAGAAAVYGGDVVRLDAVPGATPTSTGPLGDAAHATTLVAADPSGAQAVEITVEWRVQNLIDILVVRGRAGGTRPDDALVLAHRQTSAELGLTTPPRSPVAGPRPSAS